MSSFDEESTEGRTADAEAVVIMEGEAEDDDSHAVAVAVLYDDDEDDDESMVHDDEATVKSVLTYDDKSVLTTESQEVTPTRKEKPGRSRKSKPKQQASHRRSPCANKGRSPAVRGLTIPFRAVKRIMKLDPDIGTVQNEAAILVTLASELFVKSLAKESYLNAKSRGRGTIR